MINLDNKLLRERTLVWIGMSPGLKFFFSVLQQCLDFLGVGDMLVAFELGTDVQSLLAPQIALDIPVEGELQRTLVQGLNMATVRVLQGAGGSSCGRHCCKAFQRYVSPCLGGLI